LPTPPTLSSPPFPPPPAPPPRVCYYVFTTPPPTLFSPRSSPPPLLINCSQDESGLQTMRTGLLLLDQISFFRVHPHFSCHLFSPVKTPNPRVYFCFSYASVCKNLCFLIASMVTTNFPPVPSDSRLISVFIPPFQYKICPDVEMMPTK